MKIVSWADWLDKIIPYYESNRYRDRFSADPPESVMIIYPYDEIRNRQIDDRKRWGGWDQVSEQIVDSANSRVSPLFLERDTKQEWYWAFWERHDAVLVALKLL